MGSAAVARGISWSPHNRAKEGSILADDDGSGRPRDRLIITIFSLVLLGGGAVAAFMWTPWAGLLAFGAAAIALLTALYAAQPTVAGAGAQSLAPGELPPNLVDLETGVASPVLLEVFWSIEASRFERSGLPFSFAIIEVRPTAATSERTLPAGLMSAVAERIETIARGYDIVARVAPNRFAVLLPETEPEGARTFINRVRQSTETQPISLAGGSAHVDVTGGGATWSTRMTRLSDLVRAAEADRHAFEMELAAQAREWQARER